MSNADFTVEILKAAPFATLGPGDLIDLTDRCSLEDIGSINRAVDRDLLSFKTGDVTLGFWNADGYMDDLFAFFGVDDRWQLRIFRRGAIQFWGVIVPHGSLSFDRKEQTCEITAYGLTRHLKDTSAATVTRTIADMTVTTATGGQSSITLNSTAGLLTGDVLRVSDHINAESVTVKQVTSATVVALEAALANSYASGSPVILTTQFYRFKSVDFLVRELFDAAGVPVSDIRISESEFRHPAPSPVNLTGLDLTLYAYAAPAEANGRAYVTAGEITGNVVTKYQETPDGDWTTADTLGAYLDWSRYFTEDEGQPAEYLRSPLRVEADPNGGTVPHAMGYDPRGTQRLFTFDRVQAGSTRIMRYDWSGAAWTGPTAVSNVPAGGTDQGVKESYGVEHDHVRDLLYVFWEDTGTYYSYVYDIGGATWTNLIAGADGTNRYFGFCFNAELDCVLAMYGPSPTTCTQIAALRGTARLWLRDFPAATAGADASTPFYFPTQTMRTVNGELLCVAAADGKLQLVRSADEFRTYTMRSVSETSAKYRLTAARVLGEYRIVGYSSTVQRAHLVAAPFYAGVIEYADFTSQSCADALKELAILVNALFWIDDDGQGHFVSRDLFDAGAVTEIDDRIIDRADDAIWEETVSYVEVTGGSVSAVSGDNDFAASGLSLSSAFVPNEAYAQALADDYFDTYGKRRAFLEVTLLDPDGHIYRPLDRVTIAGIRYLVYESDHNLAEDEVAVKLLEDA